MPSPSQDIIQLLMVFAQAFTVPTFANALVLLYGTILSPGRRTVTAALRAMGLADSPHFTNYHRVLKSFIKNTHKDTFHYRAYHPSHSSAARAILCHRTASAEREWLFVQNPTRRWRVPAHTIGLDRSGAASNHFA